MLDLHTHSTFSDGTLTPDQLAAYAAGRRLSVLAITDHDTLAAVEPAAIAGQRHNLTMIPGIELSTFHGSTPLHILGYGFDHQHPKLVQAVAASQHIRHNRNRKILARLDRLGIHLDPAALVSERGGQIGRPHFARLLVQQGVAHSMEHAFKAFLGKNGAAYVAKERFAARQAIAAITDAGGLAVLAHPLCTGFSMAAIDSLLQELTPLGLAGLEIFYPGQSPAARRQLQAMAHRLDLVATGGSDFHGPPRAGDGNDAGYRDPQLTVRQLTPFLTRLGINPKR